MVTDANGTPLASTLPSGYGPAQFPGAYALPTTSSSDATIAIVDAYDAPDIKSDLDVYNATFDVEAAHAICQNCRILLVEARSNKFSDLATA